MQVNKLLKKKRQLNLGIDMASAFIKAVVIDTSKPKPELISFAYEPVGTDKTSALKRAINQLKLTNTEAVTSISGPSVAVRIIEMPPMNDGELKSAVAFEAEKYIPYKLDDVITDCARIENLPNGKISVLLVAAKKSTVTDAIQLLSSAGVTLRAVDVDSFAAMRTLLNSEKIEEGTTCALIDIGASLTNVNIIRNGISYIARDIQIGGNNITTAIAERLNLKQEAAEAAKIKPGELLNEITPIVKGVLINLLDEIRLSFDFYENRFGKNIQKVFISGGSSVLSVGLDNLLKEIFSGEVLFLDPFNNLDISPEINKQALEPLKPFFAVAVGLALREN
ncbi:MAG: type IV pilus assembly protein PilM [Candidatus Omnitrophota bacterium]